MHMQVLHFLTPVGPGIDQRAEAVGHAQLLHQPRRQTQHVPEQRVMLRTHIGQGRDVLLGNDQHMHRGPGVDVVEGEHLLVLVNLARRDLPGNDLAEDAIRVCAHDSSDSR